jgi:hypothetical protein
MPATCREGGLASRSRSAISSTKAIGGNGIAFANYTYVGVKSADGAK